jgi:hypothetical protein
MSVFERGECPVDELPPYHFAMVSIDALRIENYQRPRNDKFVSKGVAGYDDEGMKPISVVPLTDGTYAVIDGQHRVAIREERGFHFVCALVFPQRDPVARANMYLNDNTRLKVLSPNDKYEAGWRAGREPWKSIHDAAEASGIRLGRYLKTPMSTRSVGALAVIYSSAKGSKPAAVQDTLVCLAAAGWSEYGPLSSEAVMAVGGLLARYPAADTALLTDVLKGTEEGPFRNEAMRRAGAQGTKGGGSVRTALVDLLVERYNRYARKAHKPTL